MLLHSKERQLLELCTVLRVTEKETDDLMVTGRVFIGNCNTIYNIELQVLLMLSFLQWHCSQDFKYFLENT